MCQKELPIFGDFFIQHMLCTSSGLTLNFCMAFVKLQSRMDKVENLAFNNFRWIEIGKFPFSVKNWISFRTSSGIHRYLVEYSSVLESNTWLWQLLNVVSVILLEFLGQLKFAFHGHSWRFDLRSRCSLISTPFFGLWRPPNSHPKPRCLILWSSCRNNRFFIIVNPCFLP